MSCLSLTFWVKCRFEGFSPLTNHHQGYIPSAAPVELLGVQYHMTAVALGVSLVLLHVAVNVNEYIRNSFTEEKNIHSSIVSKRYLLQENSFSLMTVSEWLLGPTHLFSNTADYCV